MSTASASPCCAAFSLHVTMSLLSTYQRRQTELGQMDTMRKATHLDSIVRTPDYHDGHAGLLRGEGQVEDFMDNYAATSGPEKALHTYAFLATLASVCISVVAGFLMNYLRSQDLLKIFQYASACGSATALSHTLATREEVEAFIVAEDIRKIGQLHHCPCHYIT